MNPERAAACSGAHLVRDRARVRIRVRATARVRVGVRVRVRVGVRVGVRVRVRVRVPWSHPASSRLIGSAPRCSKSCARAWMVKGGDRRL